MPFVQEKRDKPVDLPALSSTELVSSLAAVVSADGLSAPVGRLKRDQLDPTDAIAFRLLEQAWSSGLAPTSPDTELAGGLGRILLDVWRRGRTKLAQALIDAGANTAPLLAESLLATDDDYWLAQAKLQIPAASTQWTHFCDAPNATKKSAPNRPAASRQLPLAAAASVNNHNAIRALIAIGHDAAACDGLVFSRVSCEELPSHIHTRELLIDAARGRLAQTNALTHALSAEYANGRNADKRLERLLEALRGAGAPIDGYRPKPPQTLRPLCEAIELGNAVAVDWLIRSGANVNIDRGAPLRYAVDGLLDSVVNDQGEEVVARQRKIFVSLINAGADILKLEKLTINGEERLQACANVRASCLENGNAKTLSSNAQKWLPETLALIEATFNRARLHKRPAKRSASLGASSARALPGSHRSRL